MFRLSGSSSRTSLVSNPAQSHVRQSPVAPQQKKRKITGPDGAAFRRSEAAEMCKPHGRDGIPFSLLNNAALTGDQNLSSREREAHAFRQSLQSHYLGRGPRFSLILREMDCHLVKGLGITLGKVLVRAINLPSCIRLIVGTPAVRMSKMCFMFEERWS